MMSEENADASSPTSAGLGLPSWILLFVFAVTPVVFATGFSQFEILKDAVLVVGVGAVLVAWAVGVATRDRVSFVAGRVLVLGLASALYVAAAALWSPGVLYGAVSASYVVALFGIVLVVSAPIGRPIRFVEFATAVGVGTGLAAATGLLDLAGLGVFTVIWDPPGYTGAFDSMEFAVAYYGVTLPVVVAGTQYAGGRQRAGFGVAAVLGALHFGLVANWTYFGFFAAACLVVAALILLFEGGETIMVLAPLGVMVGVVLLINLVAASFLAGPSEPTDATALPLLENSPGVSQGAVEDKRIRNATFSIDRIESVRSMETRGYLASVAFDLYQERPIFGHGAGAWWRLQTKVPNVDHPAVQKRFTHYPAYRSPHSALSKLLVEYGAAGFSLFLLWLIGCATIAVGALRRPTENPDLIDEQWGLWAAGIGGALLAVFTPLIELAPAAAAWIGAIAVLTRRSAEVNGYQGASMRWELSPDASGSGPIRTLATGGAGLLAVGMVAVASLDTVSRLYRGWGDHMMLRTYYERAIDRYEDADEWMPIHGGAVYDLALAKSRLGKLGSSATELSRRSADESGEGNEGSGAGTAETASSADAGTPERAEGDESGSEPDAGSAGGPSKGAPRAGGSPQSPSSPTAALLESDEHALLQRAVEMRPHDTRPLTLLAEFYVRMGFSQKALDVARRAVSANPNSMPARKTLATALRTIGQYQESAKQFLAALEREPPTSARYTIHYQLGELYFRGLEEYANAEEHLKKARELADSRAAAKRAKDTLKTVREQMKRKRKMREGKLPEDAPKPHPGKGGGKPPTEMEPPVGGEKAPSEMDTPDDSGNSPAEESEEGGE